MLSNYVTSGIRTGAPMVAAWLLLHLTFLSKLVTGEQAQTGLAFLLAMGWYLIVRGVEAKYPNGFRVPGVPFTIDLGWLLGVPARPDYTPVAPVVPLAPSNVALLPPPAAP